MKNERGCIWFGIWETSRIRKGLCFNPGSNLFDAQCSTKDNTHCKLESDCGKYREK